MLNFIENETRYAIYTKDLKIIVENAQFALVS